MPTDPVNPDPTPDTEAPAVAPSPESAAAQPVPETEPAAETEAAPGTAPAAESETAAEEDTPAAKRTKTTRERAEERRQEKLDYVREQVDSGSLVIRRMTDDELKNNQPRPVTPKPPGRRGR